MSSSQIGLNVELPDEITTLITVGLNIRSAGRLSRTATHFCNFFRKPDFWMAKIAAEFNITPEMFIKLSEIIDANEYMGIYQRLRKLKMSLAHLPKSVRYTYLDEENKFFILACCTDRPDYFLKIMNPEEFMLWLELSLYAGCVRIPTLFYTKTLEAYFPMGPISDMPEVAKKNIDDEIVEMTIKANRLDMVKYLFKPNNLSIERNIRFLIFAAQQGKNDIVDFYLNPINNFNFNINECVKRLYERIEEQDNCALNQAAANGHFETVKKLMLHGATPNERTIVCAGKSGDLAMLRFFVETHNIRPVQKTLYSAIIQGNLEVYNYLIQEEFTLNPQADQYAYGLSKNPLFREKITPKTRGTIDLDHLNNEIAASGDLAELRSILEDENSGTRLIPNGDTLYHAAGSGNLEMVKYLIHEFNLAPDHGTLVGAVDIGNLSLVRFLLSPGNHFHVRVNEAALEMGEGVAIKRLVNSHGGFMLALDLLSENDQEIQDQVQKLLLSMEPSVHKNDFIIMQLMQSFSSAPRYHLNRLLDVLINLTNYNLSSSAISFLRDYSFLLITQMEAPHPPEDKEEFMGNNREFMNSVLNEFAAELEKNKETLTRTLRPK